MKILLLIIIIIIIICVVIIINIMMIIMIGQTLTYPPLPVRVALPGRAAMVFGRPSQNKNN